MGIDGGPDGFDRRRTPGPTVGVAVDAATESDGQLWLGYDVIAIDPYRRRALEAEELGIVGAANEHHLDRHLDDAFAENCLEVAMGLLEMRTVLDHQQLNSKVCHAGSLHLLTESRAGDRLGNEAVRRRPELHVNAGYSTACVACNQGPIRA